MPENGGSFLRLSVFPEVLQKTVENFQNGNITVTWTPDRSVEKIPKLMGTANKGQSLIFPIPTGPI